MNLPSFPADPGKSHIAASRLVLRVERCELGDVLPADLLRPHAD